MERDKIDIDSIDIINPTDDSAEWQPAHKSNHHSPMNKKQYSPPKPFKSFKNENSNSKNKNKNKKNKDKRLPFSKYSIIKILETSTNDTNYSENDILIKMNMIKDLLSLTTLIKMQYGKVTEWAQPIFKLDVNKFKQLFNFRYGAHTISNDISKFEIPVYVPWIEIDPKTKELINHSNGAGMFRTYSNQFFNLNNSQISLSVLDKTWDIDLWLSVLTNIPSIQIYTVDMINTLAALYIELIRSYSITLHKDERKEFDIYKDIKIYIDDICKYMQQEKLLVMDYINYNNWPNNIKIAMDAITEGETKFYFGSNLFYRINMHNLTYDSAEEAIKYIIGIIYCAKEKKTIEKDGIFELENSEIINNKIIKLIYNILKMPKEVNIKLTTYKVVAGSEIVLHHNKIQLLAAIFKYIIGFDRQYEKPLPKINRFCLLWNVIKQYSTKKICDARIIDEDEQECISNKLDDVDYIYNVVESVQTNLLGLIQVIGYRLLTLLPNTTQVSLNSRQITCIEEFINTDIKNINYIDLIFKLPTEFKIWLDYINGNVKNIPYKFNYTPIKLYRERCKKGLITYSCLPGALTMNPGFNNVLSRLIDMKTPDVMGFPFDI